MAEFYSARGWEIPPLPWTNLSPPFSSGEAGKIRFTSAILPPYLRRAKSIEELLPWLYLKGISTGDFTEALAALLGPDAPGLSASTITRLKDVWQGELARWEKRGRVPGRGVGVVGASVSCG